MKNNDITATQISLPKGGGAIQGIGEKFLANEFTGTSSLSFPIFTSSCRNFEPQLSTEYSSGAGNGVFGLGWSISIPNISRKTSKGIPQYNESDTFLISNAEDLVSVIDSNRTETINNIQYKVMAYRPRLEGLFAQIEQWVEEQNGDSYWRVIDTNNVTSIFGKTENARIIDPEKPERVFQWLLQETFDAKGNYIIYEYKSENTDNIPETISELNRTQTSNKYIKTIKYGNTSPFLEGKTSQLTWLFEVVFDYGEYKIDNPYTPLQTWTKRQDSFSTYHAGFEIRTHRLCRRILMFHHFSELDSQPVLVHATHFYYQESPTVTLLTKVESSGYRYENKQYQIKKLPPLEFKYTAFEPAKTQFEPMVGEKGEFLPGLNFPPDYQLIDLYGEGVPGILYSDGQTTLYREPLTDDNGKETVTVKYADPKTLLSLPIQGQNEGINPHLMDITGDGQLALVVRQGGTTGYYEVNPDRSWQNHQTFPAFPTDFYNSDNYLVDVTGDGLADLLLVENDNIWVYPSLGKNGFAQPIIKKRENGLPFLKRGAKNQLLQFADIFGTGMQHLVRVTNGKVECWPNLGYGRFGKPILLENAPSFGEDFDASRLFLADIDGSGTTDLIYVYPERIEVYFNQSGNSFSDPLVIHLPSKWELLNQIEFADVHGNGTTCLIFSENHPHPRHWCYDFSHQQKPYLLNAIDNNLGAKSTISYCSSTKFYLADKQRGTPGIVNLPFPVQVVEKTESIDEISHSKLLSIYSYHHGFYDGIEREFRGFGMVERQDAEILTSDSQPTDVPPILTKTWYHTGAWKQQEMLSQQYQKEYFQGDTQAYLLPDSVFDDLPTDAEDLREVHRALKGMVLREEVYSLDKSSLVNNPYMMTETNYLVKRLQPKGTNEYGVYFVHPRETLTYHYERNPQDPRIQHDFVLEITPFGNVKKACSVYYGRRNTTDPNLRIYPEQTQLKATATLSELIEKTGNFRLIGVPYQQKTLEINGLSLPGKQYFSFTEVESQINTALSQQIAYGVEFGDNSLKSRLISWDESYFWNKQQDEFLPLGEITDKALLHHHQHTVFSEQWLESVYENKLNRKLLEEQGGYLKENKPNTDPDFNAYQDYWWNKGLVQHYFNATQPERFYLPYQTKNDFAENPQPPQIAQIDGLKVKTVVSYDQYYLLPVQIENYITDTEKNVITAEIDYRTLTPWQITDENGIIHQALFDSLGMVIATSIFKEAKNAYPRRGDGDLKNFIRKDATFEQIIPNNGLDEDVLASYLQGATTFFYYDLFAWQERQQPPSYISLARQTHVSDLQAGDRSLIQVTVGYSDGFGREIESKLAVEGGEAILRDGNGNLQRNDNTQTVRGQVAVRWLVSGHTVYNNKGKPAKQYLPYFSNTAHYEIQEEIIKEKLVPPPTVIYYDPLLREIKIETPKGFCLQEKTVNSEIPFSLKSYEIAAEKGVFSKVEFTPWESKHYDFNDTVKESAYYQAFLLYYQEFIKNYPANPSKEQQAKKDALNNEMNALNKAAVFYNTPSVAVLDILGNAFLSIENNLGTVAKDTFKDIVTGTVTSENVWNLLIEKGYLSRDPADANIAYVTVKFNPYCQEFKEQFINDLSESLKPLGEAILNLLRQNCLTSYHFYDIQGRLIESIDPRLYYANLTQGTSYYNFKYQYPMGDDGKNQSLTDSADAGTNRSLNNIFGSFLWNRSPRNFDQVIEYDCLQRKTKIQVKGFKPDGTLVTDNLVETFVYGESQPDAEVSNLRGKLYLHQDQSGQIVNSNYNILGQLLVTSRQFTVGYKDYINWGTTVELEKDNNGNPKLYVNQYSFSALQQLISETTPDGSVTTNSYNREGLLDQVSVKFKDGTVQNVISQITYDANRQRIKFIYGNGVNTTYCYEDTTLHLIKLYSIRSGKDAQGNDRKTVIQDISYVYDSVGNITRSYDHSNETVFYNNQMVEPLSDYTYDALYRLIRSNGRQHPGINVNTYRNNEKDGDFKQSKYVALNDGNALENYQESYGYDEAGNLIKTSHSAANSWTRTQEIMPNSNRLKSVKSGNGVNDSYEVSYDDSGNMKQLNVNSNVDLIWNCRDNLVGVEIIHRPDDLDDCDYYTYDSNEMRTRKVSKRLGNGGAIVWKEEKRYLGNYEEKYVKNKTEKGEQTVLLRQSLRVMDGQSCVAIIHYWQQDDNKREVDQVGTRSVRFQLGNHLGSVALEVDKDADIISYEEYFPYGGTALIAGRNQREVKVKEYRYSGKERDDSTGLYYYGARYYAPWLGRWISCDPAGTVDGFNLYAFVGGNTISFIDIRGYEKQKPKQKAQQKKSKIKKQPDKKTTKTKYQVGQHGFKKKEQKRLQEKYKIALSGSTHESEHTVGFEPLNQTSGLKRGTAGVARTLENTAPAYQEVKELHRQHIGTGTHSQRDESGFNSAEYRQTQRSLIEQREVGIAVQINQLGYAFDPNFRKLATTTEFQAATDSFNVMVENLNSLEFLQGINPVKVAVTPKQKVEMYLSRFVVIKGRYPTKQEEEDAKKKFGVT
jgi:RHS repeat-associated protein